jgi:hypothetical protein
VGNFLQLGHSKADESKGGGAFEIVLQ